MADREGPNEIKERLLAEVSAAGRGWVEMVYEFKVIPELDYAEADWGGNLTLSGARYLAIEEAFGIHVMISQKAPKAVVVTALEDFLEALKSGEEDPRGRELQKFFGEESAS